MKFDLTKEELWKIKLDNNWQASVSDHAMVDHMKLYEGSSDDYLFGTTRTHLRESSATQTHTQIHIFRVRLKSKSDHKIDASGAHYVSQLDSTDLGVGSYVTGISNELENSDMEFHLLLFDAENKKLYYMKPHLN